MRRALLLMLLAVASKGTYAQKSSVCQDVYRATRDDRTASATPGGPAQLIKVTSPSDTTYFLTLKTGGNILVSDVKGIKVLLAGGRIIEDEETAVKPTGDKLPSGEYEYEASVQLNKSQFLSLVLHKVVGFNLYLFDGVLPDPDAEKLKQYALCLF